MQIFADRIEDDPDKLQLAKDRMDLIYSLMQKGTSFGGPFLLKIFFILPISLLAGDYVSLGEFLSG